ncbi:MAG: hypothetical protein WBB85_08205 [Albidovulum sp.]|uniref:hypothetical protein n=1 Tax=Albidovulum sp. TaxID=1872424 RepID=UPI003C860B39
MERAGIEQSPEREFALDHNRTLGDGGDRSPISGDVGCAELDLEPEIGARLERKSTPIGQRIELEGISYLLLPPGQIEPTHCTINGEKLPCLRRKER